MNVCVYVTQEKFHEVTYTLSAGSEHSVSHQTVISKSHLPPNGPLPTCPTPRPFILRPHHLPPSQIPISAFDPFALLGFLPLPRPCALLPALLSPTVPRTRKVLSLSRSDLPDLHLPGATRPSLRSGGDPARPRREGMEGWLRPGELLHKRICERLGRQELALLEVWSVLQLALSLLTFRPFRVFRRLTFRFFRFPVLITPSFSVDSTFTAHRKLLSPCFSAATISKDVFPILNDKIDHLLASWTPQKAFDAEHSLFLLTKEVVLSFIFGVNMDLLEDEKCEGHQVVDWIEVVFNVSILFVFLPSDQAINPSTS
jgi:hypothetical protein